MKKKTKKINKDKKISKVDMNIVFRIEDIFNEYGSKRKITAKFLIK